jgi:hypothetical protein
MIRQPNTSAREKVVAEAIREFVSELRMVDIADYIAFIRMERFGNVSDLVDSAAELYFMPGTLKLGHGGEAHVDWTGEPRIVLDLELRPQGVIVYFALTLTAKHASVDVNYVSFANPDADPDVNTRQLEEALIAARIRKTLPPQAMQASL